MLSYLCTPPPALARADCHVRRTLQFHHPNITGLTTGVTTFHRMNFATNLWEIAGQIEWSSNYSAFITFGVDRVRFIFLAYQQVFRERLLKRARTRFPSENSGRRKRIPASAYLCEFEALETLGSPVLRLTFIFYSVQVPSI